MEKKEGLRVLFIGDIVGEPGRDAVKALLPDLVIDNLVDFVIANCENAAAGKGITPKITEYLLNTGIHVLTSGNHIWDRQEIIPYIGTQPRLLRPACPTGFQSIGTSSSVSRAIPRWGRSPVR